MFYVQDQIPVKVQELMMPEEDEMLWLQVHIPYQKAVTHPFNSSWLKSWFKRTVLATVLLYCVVAFLSTIATP